jgi:hypothetical protein
VLADFVRTHPQVECAIKSAAHEILPCAAGAEHSRAQVWYVVESS